MPEGLMDPAAGDAGGVGELDSYRGALGGMTRRNFLRFCTGVAASLGLSPAMGVQIANAASAARRPSVIWLSGQACTGCTESLLRTHHPTLETLILDQISLEYNEALLAGSGHQAEAWKAQAIKENWGKYVLVTDGAIPMKENGAYCKIGGKTILEHVQEAAKGAAAVIAMGSCAAWGGVPAAGINPTGALPVHKVIKDKPVVNIPGCPPNAYNFLATVLHFITFAKLPDLDEKNRPKFAYGRLIHENCERRAHFDAGRFAMEFGDTGHRLGYCLYKIGCKGPETYANCPAVGFGDVGVGSWPVGTGHPCVGCTEEGVGFAKGIHELASLKSVTPPLSYPQTNQEKGQGPTPASVATLAGIAGAAVGAGAVAASRLGRHSDAAAGAAGDDHKSHQ